MAKVKRYPVLKTMCATCPFREGSQYAFLSEALSISAATEASRVCHNTATSAISGRTGKPPMLCRGARDLQLRMFAAMGFIESATDESWEKKCREMKI